MANNMSFFDKASGFLQSLGSKPAEKLGSFGTGVLQKYVSQDGVSPRAVTWTNQYNTPSLGGGISKEGRGVSFEVLRRIAEADAIVSNCITIIKKSISQSPYRITKLPNAKKAAQKEVDAAYRFFQFINPDMENFRMLIDRSVEDILTIDAGVWEVLRNAYGEVAGINSVDGATIRFKLNKHGEQNEDDAFVQVVNTKVVETFSKDEMIYMMMNPPTNIRRYPYGMSPVEKMMFEITNNLNAEVHNSQMFGRDNIPAGLLNLGANINAYDAEAFIASWDNQTIGNTSQMRFMWGPDKMDFLDFKKSNRDMQYIEYLDRLTRIILAAFGLSAIDLNIVADINRSTASSQTKLSNARGVRSVQHLIEETINTRLFPMMGFKTIRFEYEPTTDYDQKLIQAQVDEKYLNTGVYSINEVRERDGLPSISGGDTMQMTEDVAVKARKGSYQTMYQY